MTGGQVVDDGLGNRGLPGGDADFDKLQFAEELAPAGKLPLHFLHHGVDGFFRLSGLQRFIRQIVTVGEFSMPAGRGMVFGTTGSRFGRRIRRRPRPPESAFPPPIPAAMLAFRHWRQECHRAG